MLNQKEKNERVGDPKMERYATHIKCYSDHLALKFLFSFQTLNKISTFSIVFFIALIVWLYFYQYACKIIDLQRNLSERERGDNWLFITLVPKVF